MKTRVIAVAVLALAAGPALADKKVDDAVAKAEDQRQKGKPDEGEKTLQKLVSQMPTSGEAFDALARYQMRIARLDEAQTNAKKAVELSTGEAKAQALTTFSCLNLVSGSGKDAVAHAEEATKLKETPATLAALARAQARVQDAAAAKTAERAVQLGATSADAQQALGEVLRAQHHDKEATAAFRKALELDPKSSSARVGLALSLVAQGQAAEGVAEAKKATEADPQSGEAFAALGAALLAQNRESWNEAIAQAQQGSFLNPKNPVVQVTVGQIFEVGGNLDQAQGAYRRALEADPGYVPARAALLDIQVRKGELDAALAEAQKLAAASPGSVDVQLQIGRILLRKEDYVNAVGPLEKAAAGAPGLAEAHALLGMAYQYTGQRPEALASYKKAVELAPQNLQYRATLGLLLGVAKQYEAGIAELKKVIATPGYKDTAAYTNLGWIYRNMEPSKPEDSVASYKKALELDPKNEQAALGLGWAYSYLRKWDEAIASFGKAIELEPKTAGEAYNGIAWCHYFKKDMAQAKAMAEKAKAEGRNVAGLLSNIDKVEKGHVAAAEEEQKAFREEQKGKDDGGGIATAGNTLMKGAPAARREAARKLREQGHAAVQYLVYAAVNDKDFGVREEALNSLGAIGPAAKDACRHLKEMALGANPYDKVMQTPEERLLYVKWEDLRKVAKAAVAKIGC
jgi:tetratricopeptide (TPR) repeat protein